MGRAAPAAMKRGSVFRHAIPMGRLFGISIDLDYSWFLIVGLLTWMLAVSYFPAEFGPASAGEYWLMGLVTAVLLFVSVLIHELGHSVVAQNYGLQVPRITLFLFGGVSQIAAEPASAGEEFWIAVVGPLVSFALAAFFWEIEPLLSGELPWLVVAKYLALLNLILAIFNLVPGFPLDGGRVLRAAVWKATGAYRRATAAAALTGRFFGFVLIFWGVWQALEGRLIDGLWIAFIGWYLESAAGSQLQLEATKMLMGRHRVAEAMQRNFPRVRGDATVEEAVELLMSTGSSRYLVVDGGEGGEAGTQGLLTLETLRAVPRSQWGVTTVGHAMIPMEKLATASPEGALWTALEKMGREGLSQMPVVAGGVVVGMLSQEDILHYLQVLRVVATGREAPGTVYPGAGRAGPTGNRGLPSENGLAGENRPTHRP
jgi:Zn-dependent protease